MKPKDNPIKTINIEFTSYDENDVMTEESSHEFCDGSSDVQNEPTEDFLELEMQHFKKFLQLCNDSQYSLNLITKYDFNNVKNSSKLLKSHLKILLENFYNNFDKIKIYRDIFYAIYKAIRADPKSVQLFSREFEIIFREELLKICENRNWHEVIKFGALLCELLAIYEASSFLITKKMENWMKTLAYSAVDGNENAYSAFSLVLSRLSKNKNPIREGNDTFFGILEILQNSVSIASKKQQIDEYLDVKRFAKFGKDVNEKDYEKEVSTSQQCKSFETFMKSDNESLDFYDFNNFCDMADNEFEFLARCIIETAIKTPKRIDFIVFLLMKYQSSINRIRHISSYMVRTIENEIDSIRAGSSEYNSEHFAVNFGTFIGELYVNEKKLISSLTMTNWLSLWAEGEKEFKLKVMIATLEQCGLLYKLEDSENFYKFIAKMYIFAVDRDEKELIDEIQKMSNIEERILNFCDLREENVGYSSKVSAFINQFCIDRMLKPKISSELVPDITELLEKINNGIEVKLDYRTIELSGWLSREKLTQTILFGLNKTQSEPIKIAQFIKNFFEFSYSVGKLFKRLKANLELRIPKMSDDNLSEMLHISKLIAKLRTFMIINRIAQNKWLEKVESFKPLENHGVLHIQVEAIWAMMVNMHVYSKSEHVKYLSYIKELREGDIQYSAPITFKLKEIVDNFSMHEIDVVSRDLIYQIKNNWKSIKLPKDLPERDPNCYDLEDLTKSIFLHAISNKFCTKSFRNFVGKIESNPQSDTFRKFLKKLCQERFDTFIKNIKYFEEYETIAMLKFFALLFDDNFFTETEINAFLDKLEQIKNTAIGKISLEAFIRVVKGGDEKLGVVKRARRIFFELRNNSGNNRQTGVKTFLNKKFT